MSRLMVRQESIQQVQCFYESYVIIEVPTFNGISVHNIHQSWLWDRITSSIVQIPTARPDDGFDNGVGNNPDDDDVSGE